MEIIDNALVQFLLLKQHEEPLICQENQDSKRSCWVAPGRTNSSHKTLDDYDKNDTGNIQELTEQVWKKFTAYKFIKNSNHTKYRTILKHFRIR